jgi:phosphate transport system substrate-binding protein
MKGIKRTAVAGLLAASVFMLGCSGPGNSGGGGSGKRITGGGSSFVAPMMKKWAGAYRTAQGVEVDYTSSGSGNGVSQMIEKKNDFGCTDAPMNAEQMEKAQKAGGDVIHVPLVMGGVVPFYNLPDVKKPLKFTGPLLADIYLGKVKKWNEDAIKSLNQDVELPDLAITVAHRSDASGTSFIFTDFLSKVSPEWKEKVGASTEPKWPVGPGAQKSDGVAGIVADTKGAIGYVELIYALGKKGMAIGLVQNRAGKFVEATLESVTAAAAGLKDVPDDLRFSLTDADGDTAYPIAGTTWMVLYTKQPSDKADKLKAFATWLVHDGQDMNKDLHYARIPPSIVEKAEKLIAKIKAQ